jgi:hypothetical protein
MSDTAHTTEQEPMATAAERRDVVEEDRPDRRGPRGNPDVEQIDVDRGQGKIERVLGW